MPIFMQKQQPFMRHNFNVRFFLNLDARSRLETAVDQLLELMEQSNAQLLEAKATQQQLLESLAARANEYENINAKCTELRQQLLSEIEAKEFLGLELHKAEGKQHGNGGHRGRSLGQVIRSH